MANYTVTTAQNIDALTVRTGTRAGVSWTRSGTTVTCTLVPHQLLTGSLAQVTVSSDTGAVPLGSKSVTSTGSDTFTFTGVNTGATSGTLTFTQPDTLSINGGTLTIDEDTRCGPNTNRGAALGTITMSATLGGTVNIDATAVRLIAYNTGTGNAPAAGTVISQGGTTGKLICVMSAINAVPTVTGAAMPASGFIKVKQVSGAYATGALTGIGASATAADVAGWIDIVGADGSTVTASRLNSFNITGDWFSLGTASGSRATTYQLPTSGFATYYIPGVWVETAVADVYEFYPNAGTVTALLANIATDAIRGRFCWVTVASGLLRFGHDGTNSTGGYLPPAGRKIRIPNILTHCVTVAAQANYVLPNSTLATRYDFTTTGGANITFNKCSLNWYPSFLQAYGVSITDTAIMTQLTLAEIATAVTLNNVGVGQEAANAQNALIMSLCPNGGTATNCVWTRAGAPGSGAYVVAMNDVSDYVSTDERAHHLVFRSNAASGVLTATRNIDCTWHSPVWGGRAAFVTCSGMTINDVGYYDHPATTTTTSFPVSAIDISGACQNTTIDGLHFNGLVMCQPYTALLNIAAASCVNTKLRNVGTAAAPLSLGDARREGQAWTRATTTATVTSTAHGLKVNDIIYVITSDSVAAIIVSAKTVASVPTANTFTFACLNAGAASGVLSYEPTMTSGVVTSATGSASVNTSVQRVYAAQTRGVLFTFDNSNSTALIEDVWGAPYQNTVAASSNMRARKTKGVPTYAAQTGKYGAHFEDGYTTNPAPTLSALAWTRATTTATVTAAGHGKRTGDSVVVTVSSDTSAVALGVRTVTVLTSSTFTITATNAGAASGTLTIHDATARMGIVMNEASAATSAQVTLEAGTPAFTSAGTVYMPVINDRVLWEMPETVYGYSSIPIIESVLTGGGALTNFDITYAIDTGSGFSAHKNLSYPRAGASGSNGASTFTVTDATGVAVDDYVFGTSIGPNAKVTLVVGNTITVDRPNIGTVSGIARFNHLPSETISATTGFKLQIRIKTTTTNATAITSLYWWLSHVAANELVQYPLDTATYTINGLIAGSEVRAYTGTDPSTAVEIGGIENSGTSFAFEHSSGGENGYIVVMRNDYEAILISVTYTTVDQELLVQPRFDRNYENL